MSILSPIRFVQDGDLNLEPSRVSYLPTSPTLQRPISYQLPHMYSQIFIYQLQQIYVQENNVGK